MRERVEMFGLPLDVVDIQGAVDACRAAWENRERMRILTLNPIMVEAALKDDEVAGVIRRADLVVADGVGIVWAARKIHGIKAALVPGIELATALLDECEKNLRPVFLLGGKEGVAAEAAEELAANRTNLRIIGTHHGYFGADEDDRVAELVNSSRAQLVLCGMGFPRQDIMLEKIISAGKPPPCYDGAAARGPREAGPGIDEPPIPPLVGLGVGGSLDVFAGRVRRVPGIWRKLRLEWLGRIFSQPGKRLKALPQLMRFWWRVQSAKRAE